MANRRPRPVRSACSSNGPSAWLRITDGWRFESSQAGSEHSMGSSTPGRVPGIETPGGCGLRLQSHLPYSLVAGGLNRGMFNPTRTARPATAWESCLRSSVAVPSLRSRCQSRQRRQKRCQDSGNHRRGSRPRSDNACRRLNGPPSPLSPARGAVEVPHLVQRNTRAETGPGHPPVVSELCRNRRGCGRLDGVTPSR